MFFPLDKQLRSQDCDAMIAAAKTAPSESPAHDSQLLPPSHTTHRALKTEVKGKRTDIDPSPYRTCHICRTCETPEWFPGPNGPKSLCIECSYKWRRHCKEGRTFELRQHSFSSFKRLASVTSINGASPLSLPPSPSHTCLPSKMTIESLLNT